MDLSVDRVQPSRGGHTARARACTGNRAGQEEPERTPHPSSPPTPTREDSQRAARASPAPGWLWRLRRSTTRLSNSLRVPNGRWTASARPGAPGCHRLADRGCAGISTCPAPREAWQRRGRRHMHGAVSLATYCGRGAGGRRVDGSRTACCWVRSDYQASSINVGLV